MQDGQMHARKSGASNAQSRLAEARHDWTRGQAEALYHLPFNDLVFSAQTVHRRYFNPNQVQLSRLLSIKTGGCAEDCGYCSQSARHDSGLGASKLMQVEAVVAEAAKAKAAGDALLHGGCLAQPEGA